MAAEEEKKRRVSWSTVWRETKVLFRARRRRLILGFVFLVISRLAGMVLPASTKFLIDEVIGNQRADLLWWIALAAGAATLIQAGTSYALAILLGIAGQRSVNDLRIRVQKHIGRLPVRFFEENKSGELISRIMHDSEGMRNLVGSGFMQLVGGVITSAVALAVLFWLNWRLTLMTLVLLLIFAGVMIVGFSRIRPVFRERSKVMADVTGRLAESLGGIRVVKAYTAEKREERIFAAGAHTLLRKIVRSMVGVATIGSLARLLFGLVGLTMSIAGAREVLAGHMTVGDLFMFVVFTGMMVTPLMQMANIGTQITEAFAGLDRIHEVLSEPTEMTLHAGRQRLPRIDGRIEFEDVVFEYKSGEPVLRGVSFVAPAGTTTALVGPSGAGKSTVISLIMAFRQPNEGRILVDGTPLREISLHDYRSQLAVVLQDDFLFDGTIGENISYSHPRTSLAEIEAAGRLARCEEFVESFPDGYDTVIGERGVKLSGGQRQRVTIARAILADPRILILDEATSSLDTENELLIQEGLQALKQGRTSFIIAHRLSTIRNADQILVMEGGLIIERGTHEELLAANGRYKELYEKQYSLELDHFVNPGEDPTLAASTPELEQASAGRTPSPGSPFPRD
ncbi:MAG: ABC transporter ATP-binding protein [Thermoanaerobaculia bacterium]